MNKKISFFLLGSFLSALGLGFLNASINRSNISKVDAANSYLEFKDDVATLGKYPQTISHDDVFSIKTYGTLDTVTGWYTYNNKTYAIKTVELDADYRETEKFNDGSYAKNYENIEKVFLVEDLKWEILSIKDGYANIISTRVIDRQVFDNSNQKDYKKSLIYAINNAVFYESAFTEEERNYLNIFDVFYIDSFSIFDLNRRPIGPLRRKYFDHVDYLRLIIQENEIQYFSKKKNILF